MANYFLNDDGSLTKNNKKKKKGNNYILDSNGNLVLNSSKEKLTKKESIKKEEPKKRSWFNKAAFEDGYDFGDVTKTLLGTTKDVTDDMYTGVSRIGEGVIDLGAYAVGGGAKLFGNDKLADSTKKFIARNLVDEYKIGEKVAMTNPAGMTYKLFDTILNKGKTEENSVLGEKSDSLVQSAGQLAGTIGLQAAGVPWWLTTGTTSFAGGTEEAFKDDASYGKAGAYGLISAGAEILTEKISGGISFGGKTLDTGLKKVLSEKITNKTLSTLTKFGLDAVGEGGEEVLTEILQNVGKKLTYEDEKTWNELLTSEEAMDSYLEAFIGGAVLGGGMNTIKVANSIKTGRDYDTGLTDNEQKIVDTEINNRTTEIKKQRAVESRINDIINEREKTFGTLDADKKKSIRENVMKQLDDGEINYDSTELSKKELSKIQEEVENDLKKGNLDIETIENTLSSEKVAQIKELSEQLSKTTNEQQKAEIQAKINELTDAKNTELKSMLSKDLYLQNSYREANLKSEKFAYEVKETDSEYRKTLAKEFENKANNTTKSHETFEMLSKISEDKQTQYHITNNTELAELGYDVEGKDINGLVRVNEDGTSRVLINIDSNKALNRIVGHETTHLLEGTKEYTELQEMVKEYAETKGDYNRLHKELTKLYDGIDADIDAEITSELVGDYLFTDTDFINNLSTKKPNIFQKIYNEIKHLYKLATAGSKEARQLEKVKKAFDKAYKQNASNTSETDTKYSLSKDMSKRINEIKNQREELRQQLFELRQERNDITASIPNYNMFKQYDELNDVNKRMDNNKNLSKELYAELQELETKIEEVKEQEKNERIAKEEAEATPHKLAQNRIIQETNPMLDDYHIGIRSVGDIKTWQEAMSEAERLDEGYSWGDFSKEDAQKALKRGKIRVYSSYAIKNGTFVSTSYQQALDYAGGERSKVHSREVALDSVAWISVDEGQYAKVYNTKYSLSDNTGRKLSEYVLEKTKNSKVRDENGNLMLMYHGSPNGTYDQLRAGTYFTSDKEYADGYQWEGASSISYGKQVNNPRTYEAYLNITNPFTLKNETAKNIYLNEYIKGGNSAYFDPYTDYTDTINSMDEIDWVEGVDLQEWLQENHPEYDGMYLDEGGAGGYGGAEYKWRGYSVIPFSEEQIIKANNNNTEYSLSNPDEQVAPVRNDIYGTDIKLQVEEAIAPLKEAIAEIKEAIDPEYESTVDYRGLTEEDLPMWEQQNEEAFRNIDESNIPIEQENTTPDVDDEVVTPAKSLEEVRDFDEIGSRKVKAYQYEHPEVRPYFQEMARYMLGDLTDSIKGERSFNDQVYYDTNGEQGFYGVTRQTTSDIAELLDSKYKYTYNDIRKGLEAIIEDNGAENIAIAKRIELALDKRLREGYTDVAGYEIPANEEYIKLLREHEFADYYSSIPIDESMIPAEDTVEDIAPVVNASNTQVTEKVVPIKEQLKENSVVEEKEPSRVEQQTAQILDERPTPKNRDKKLKAIATVNLIDKGYYISKLARQTNNRQLDALWDNTLLSNAQAQEVIGEGRFKFNEDTKTYDKVGNSVYEIFEGLETTNKVKDFNEYMYHKLNIERMSLEANAQAKMKTLKETTLKGYTIEDINAMAKTKLREDAKQDLVDLVNAAKEYKSLSKVKNKPVFGFTTDADASIDIVNRIEQNNPEFSDYAKKVYDYESGTYSDLSLLVESGILSQEDANYYRNKYESYVPIIRDIEAGMLEGQMFGKRVSVGNAVKSATGGNQNIIPLKDAMAIKTMLVQRSANMNKLGLELMEALNPVVESETVSAENIIEDISNNKDLIQAGTNGKAPTMTVYEHGVKKTFEIPQEIYEALKPNYDSNSKITIKPLNAFSNFKRNVLTQYNPFFMVTNMIKDAQDVLINSQHPASTYKAIPEAIAQLSSKGYWYKEMQSQGLFQDTYYDNQGGFDTAPKGISKVGEFYPLKKIAEVNDFIERVPRMAEYIASRKAGRSVEVSSLDASRVTTNFKAGGDWTKFLNRNGATFLNASVQGALQQVRNVQEAHQKGLKGYMGLATKFTVAALPAVLLNALLWDDDDEYEELSDYIKDNYYIIGKYGDGQFIRIPKGRMTAVIQKTIEQMQNLITGDDEVDLGNYLELVLNNIAPSNPIENNIFSPFLNTKLFNNDDPGQTWFGGDLVPTRLQSKPAAEQYDETTDEFSKWLGEKLNLSPIKINNLIDQNTGVIGDLLLPMMTAEAKTKNDNPIAAGVEDKFTADVVFDNKYSTDFYSVKEDLAKKSNSYEATDKDILKTKYMNSKQAQMNDIYAEIRNVQNSDSDKKTKYAKVRELRKQLNEIAENSLNSYNKIKVESSYAKVGEIEFKKSTTGEWEKITSKQLEKQNEVINTFDISANEYWENKEEYDYAVENPDKYKVITQIDTYKNYISYKDGIENIKEQYKTSDNMSSKQKTALSKQRKAAVQEYINSLSLSIPKKIMLEKVGGGYSIKSYMDYMYSYIESLPMSAAEKQKLHNELFN